MEVLSDELPSYRRTILPNRSLTPHGAAVLLTCAVAATIFLTAVFVSLGAWPVLPFVWASFGAIGAMIYGMARHRDDFELLIIDDASFHVLRRHGAEQTWHRFQRYWARLYFERPRGCTATTRLYIRSHGRALEIGTSLDEPRRQALARELGDVLGHPPLKA